MVLVIFVFKFIWYTRQIVNDLKETAKVFDFKYLKLVPEDSVIPFWKKVGMIEFSNPGDSGISFGVKIN